MVEAKDEVVYSTKEFNDPEKLEKNLREWEISEFYYGFDDTPYPDETYE